MGKLGIPTDGSEGGVTIQKINFNVDPLLQKQVHCATAMIYNEYWQAIDAGLSNDDLVIFRYDDEGISTLEDGLCVDEAKLNDPVEVDKLVRFVRASMKGWDWALANPDAAADIVIEYDETGAQTEKHQRRMMGAVAKLTAGSNGSLDPEAYERTVDIVLDGGVISAVFNKIVRPPGGAFFILAASGGDIWNIWNWRLNRLWRDMHLVCEWQESNWDETHRAGIGDFSCRVSAHRRSGCNGATG